MSKHRYFLIIGILVLILFACSGSKVVFQQDPNSPLLDGDKESDVDDDATSPTDGDTTPPTDGDTTPPTDGDTTPPTDGDMNETEDEIDAVREAVDGTDGFCTMHGTPNLSCTHDSDCTTYLRATRNLSCGAVEEPLFIRFSSACDVAAAASLPKVSGSDCHADDLCKDMPRACIQGRCTDTTLNQSCDASSDCLLKDYGCACMAYFAAGMGAPSLSFGRDCPAQGGCPAGAEAVCVRGYCRVAGQFMDVTIASYCEKEITYLWNNTSVGSGNLVCQTPHAVTAAEMKNCTDYYKEDNYARAVTYWPMLLTGSLAQTCEGFLNGAWSEMHPCPVVPSRR